MSEAAVAEAPAEALETSPAGTPDSEVRQEPPSNAEVAPPNTGPKTPSAEESKPEPLRDISSPEERLAAIEAKAEANLSDEEREERRRLRQSLDDRSRAYQERLAANRAEDERVAQAAKDVPAFFYHKATELIDALMEDPDRDVPATRNLAKRLLWEEVLRFMDGARPVLEHPTKASMLADVVTIHGDGPQLRETVRKMSASQLFDYWKQNIAPVLHKAQPDPDSYVTPKGEWNNNIHQPTYQKAWDAFKAANPGAQPPPTATPRASQSSSLTLAQIDAMSTSEWMSHPKEWRDQQLAAAHEAATRR